MKLDSKSQHNLHNYFFCNLHHVGYEPRFFWFPTYFPLQSSGHIINVFPRGQVLDHPNCICISRPLTSSSSDGWRCLPEVFILFISCMFSKRRHREQQKAFLRDSSNSLSTFDLLCSSAGDFLRPKSPKFMGVSVISNNAHRMSREETKTWLSSWNTDLLKGKCLPRKVGRGRRYLGDA